MLFATGLAAELLKVAGFVKVALFELSIELGMDYRPLIEPADAKPPPWVTVADCGPVTMLCIWLFVYCLCEVLVEN